MYIKLSYFNVSGIQSETSSSAILISSFLSQCAPQPVTALLSDPFLGHAQDLATIPELEEGSAKLLTFENKSKLIVNFLQIHLPCLFQCRQQSRL
jgi:hypothetical protein